MAIHYIPRNRRENLSKYKYSGADKSLVSRYLLTPYWNNLVKLFPLSVAPNMITLMGLGFVLINFATLLYLEPTLSCSTKPILKSLGGSWDPLFPPSSAAKLYGSQWLAKVKAKVGLAGDDKILEAVCPPGWMFYSFALGLWLYQSFDAIDGKQARRTGTSGPLGELFDHGCDALNTTLECILCASALNLGQGWWTVASQVATLANFYLTTWEEYHTGTLFLSAFSGPVEGILMIIGIFAITGYKGPGFWDQGVLTTFKLNDVGLIKQLGIKDLPLNDTFMVFALVGLMFNIVASYSNVVEVRKKAKKSVVTPALGMLPFAAHTIINVLWLQAQPVILRTHLIPFMVFWGFSFAYSVGLLITSHVLKAPELFPWWHLLILWSAVGSLDANLPRLSMGRLESLFQKDEASTITFVWISLLVSLAVYAYFVTDIILDVCDFCDINCLTIKSKPKPDDTKDGQASSSAVEKRPDQQAARRRK